MRGVDTSHKEVWSGRTVVAAAAQKLGPTLSLPPSVPSPLCSLSLYCGGPARLLDECVACAWSAEVPREPSVLGCKKKKKKKVPEEERAI